MSNSLVLNNTNVIGTGNNTYQYKFIGGNFTITEGAEIAISSITMPYSWYNISTYYNNNKFSFTWTVGTTLTTYTITLPNGFYTVTDINYYLQNYCITNGFYLIDANGNNVYYLNLAYNTVYYGIELLEFPVPTSLPAGYTQPANFAGYPTTATTPQFILPATGSIGSIIGYTPGTYGVGGSLPQSFISNITPNGSNVNSVIVRCSLVNNRIASPTDIIDSFPINAVFGANINYVPNFEKWIRLQAGTYASFTVSFYDQNLIPLNANDSNVLITLLIRQ